MPGPYLFDRETLRLKLTDSVAKQVSERLRVWAVGACSKSLRGATDRLGME